MNCFFLCIIISLIPIMHSFYNPVPIGSVIISTLRTISVIQPKEYGGTDKPSIIFTAIQNMTIVNTIFDSTSRDLYILFSNATDNIIYIRQLISVEKLDSVVYQLPISFNVSDINKFTSFSSDFQNKRAFLTSQSGVLTMFSMSGTMQTIISYPSSIIDPIRSVGYNQILNRLFIITHSTVYSCIGLDTNNLQCCRALPQVNQLRSITFDTLTNKLLVYVLDERSGIYRVSVNETTGCPTDLSPISALGGYYNIYLAMYQDLHFSSGSNDNSNHNSILVIGNGTQTARTIPFDASIVALHTSYPNLKSATDKEETCFHGITYYDYRVAVVLAAIFGTVMGIFMCFNALFCIDFFMTKRIIRDLKKQIPHNLLEDRWNKLVQEKYAKLALESKFHSISHNPFNFHFYQ
jgi:hypothetical protein